MEGQPTQTIDFKALGKLVRPLELVLPEADAPLPEAVVMGAEFDEHVERLRRRHQRTLSLRNEHASLKIDSESRNDGDGWGDRVSPWNSSSWTVTLAYGEKSQDYQGKTLHQYLSFTSRQRYHADSPDGSRTRSIGVGFSFETIVPTVPKSPILCETFGIPFPTGKKKDGYDIKTIQRPGELGPEETRRAFQLGLAVVAAWVQHT